MEIEVNELASVVKASPSLEKTISTVGGAVGTPKNGTGAADDSTYSWFFCNLPPFKTYSRLSGCIQGSPRLSMVTGLDWLRRMR